MRPILFEDMGASPDSPRIIYEKAIETSKFFVGIYADKYGQLLPGSTISGLEDEFELSADLPRLIYVKNVENEQRDPKLTALIQRIEREAKVTYGHYDTPEELAKKVRVDIVHQLSTPASSIDDSVLAPDYTADLKTTLAEATHLLPRSDLLGRIVSTLDESHTVAVTGPGGCGKTFLLGLLACQKPSVYVSTSNRDLSSIAAHLATRVSLTLGKTVPREFLNADQAINLLIKIASPDVLLLLDDCTANLEVSKTLVEQLQGHYLLVLSFESAEAANHIGGIPIQVPPLTYEETLELTKAEGLDLTPPRVHEVLQQTGGNPRLLSNIELDTNGTPQTLDAYFRRQWSRLSSSQRDLAAMVSLAYGGDILVEDLMGLQSQAKTDAGSLSQLVVDLDSANSFLQCHGTRVSMTGETVRQWLVTRLQSQGVYDAYHRQLGQYFKSKGYILRACYHLLAAGDPEAGAVLPQAMILASVQGNWSLARQLATDYISGSFGDDRVAEAHFVLSGVYAAEGDVARAEQEADKAISLSGDHGSLNIRAWKATLLVGTVHAGEAIGILEEALSRCPEEDAGDRGIIHMNLAFVCMNLGLYQRVIDYTKSASEDSSRAGDSFGVQMAEVNLAGAMVELRRYDEASPILERRLDAARKDGLWEVVMIVLNQRARLRRMTGDPSGARDDLAECVRLSKITGDVRRQAMDITNLGNAYMDMEKLDEAEQCYREGLQLAEAHSLLPTATHAKQLLGRVRIEKGDMKGAAIFLEQSLTESRTYVDRARIAFAAEWLGYVRKEQRLWHEAALLYRESASAYREMPDTDADYRDLLLGADCANRAGEVPLAQGLLLDYERDKYRNVSITSGLVTALEPQDDAERLVLLALHTGNRPLLRTSLHLLLMSGGSSQIAETLDNSYRLEDPEAITHDGALLWALAGCLLVSETPISVAPIVNWCVRHQPGAPRIAWRHADSASFLDCVILSSHPAGRVLEETLLIPNTARVFKLAFGSVLASCAVDGLPDVKPSEGSPSQMQAQHVMICTPDDVKDNSLDDAVLEVQSQPRIGTSDTQQTGFGTRSTSFVIVDPDKADHDYAFMLLFSVMMCAEQALSPYLSEEAMKKQVQGVIHSVLEVV
jgi:tetratricopeptide (TPR) repeat protein/energy-coupling factor transporter ATP-binding protein EcfA2